MIIDIDRNNTDYNLYKLYIDHLIIYNTNNLF